MKTRHHLVNGKWRHLAGVRRSSPRRAVRRALAIPTAALPKRSDDNARKLQLRVEDQETVGCCTGEGVTSAMEAALFLVYGVWIQLSALWLYFYSRAYEGTPPGEDSGCEIPDVVEVTIAKGCAQDEAWPFDASKFSQAPPAALDEQAAQHKTLLDFECETDEQTKHSLVQGFPVVCGFEVPNGMMTEECAHTGMVSSTTPDDMAGAHCVLIVDYDDEIDVNGERGGWKCLNSWGEGWALGGYFWLSYKCHPSDRFTFRRVAA